MAMMKKLRKKEKREKILTLSFSPVSLRVLAALRQRPSTFHADEVALASLHRCEVIELRRRNRVVDLKFLCSGVPPCDIPVVAFNRRQRIAYVL